MADVPNYKVGDKVFVEERRQWSANNVSEWEVAKITPSGQMVLKRDGLEERVSARGRFSGDTNFLKSIVDAARAEELKHEKQLEQLWYDVRSAADRIDRAARGKNIDALKAASDALADLRTKIESRHD